jgi:hypothetical protein
MAFRLRWLLRASEDADVALWTTDHLPEGIFHEKYPLGAS